MFKPVLHRIAAFLEVTRWIIIILAGLIMGLYFYLHRKDADHATIAPLPHTDWVVYGYPGHDEGWINTVIARNEKTGENIKVATIRAFSI